MAKFRCNLVVSQAPANPVLATEDLFDKGYSEVTDSPIDEFFSRIQAINCLSPRPDQFDSLHGQLILLGAIAAVESYIRTLFRRLISIDPICQECVHEKEVSYGAALHLPVDLLPEAILERISFVSKKSIVDALKDLLGVKGNLPPELSVSIDDYARVCQLRNCAVHRFGKLGSNNAIKLGLAEHKSLLEKPLKIDYAALQNAIAISTGIVRTLNNFLFNEMLSRLPDRTWSGVYRQDKAAFVKYYKLFAEKVSISKSPNSYLLYKQFRAQRAKYAVG